MIQVIDFGALSCRSNNINLVAIFDVTKLQKKLNPFAKNCKNNKKICVAFSTI